MAGPGWSWDNRPRLEIRFRREPSGVPTSSEDKEMQDGEGEARLMAGGWQAQGRREEGWSWLGQERGRVQAVELSKGKEDNWSLLHDFGNGRSGVDSV